MTSIDNAVAEAQANVERHREHVRVVRQRAATGLAGAAEVSVAEYELHGALRKLDALTNDEPDAA